ncbi:TolC family protein [Roseateles aquatilis]|nr:TolC family protein [Roseateles aquatilis]
MTAAPITLAAVLEAAASNADARIARLGVDAARADVVAADHAPLPVLTAKASSMDLQHGVGGGNWLTEKRVDKSLGVDWTWERGGKRALRTAAAEAAAGAARQDWRAVRRDQQILAATAFHDLRLAQSRVEDLRELAAGAEALATLMRRRVQAGDAAPQDLSRAEIEARKAANDVAAARTDRENAALALGRLIGRPEMRLTAAAPDDAGGEATAVSAIPADAGDDTPTDPDGLRAAIDASPDVAAADARQGAALAAYDLARAGKHADVTWGVSLDHYPGTSTRLLELRLQMPLQFGYQQQGEIGRAQSQLDQAREQAQQARADAETALRQRWLALSSSRALLRSHEADLLPRARALLAQAELAYRKGASTLTDLIEARRTLRASLMDALAARHDHDVALAQWRLLTQP